MFLFRVPGRGMVRRMIFLMICGVAFWGGTEVQRALMVQRCIDAGGAVDSRSVCRGLPR